uniref:Phytanoyl-CoA dioxygenase n=1 Tax=Vannella robusta TaxID=1487602 RepID=A0A7S4IBL5_9EUKA|mmetsp:Transcript_23411/g.29841  ORF Transcript_23411/g.29841 Transcript_23411/m.29841 type:complete len:324 (+) Transcript_23411:193-1164(+)
MSECLPSAIPNYSINQREEILQFWNTWGFVVIRDVLSPSETDATISEIWDVVEDQSNGEVSRNKAATWYNPETWPDKTQKGFIQPFSDFLLQQCWLNRQNTQIINAFQLLLDTEEIVCSRDRYGFMRPTTLSISELKEKDFSTTKNWLHWDQNGWSNSGFQSVQGVLTLTPHTESSGGFHCVPGFTHEFREYFDSHAQDEHPNGYDGLVEVLPGDCIRERVRKITCPAGSMIIWDSRLPHGNYPNESDGFRAVQYITYHAYEPDSALMRKENLEREARNAYRTYGDEWDEKLPPKDLQLPHLLSSIGRKVVGFEPWTTDVNSQ